MHRRRYYLLGTITIKKLIFLIIFNEFQYINLKHTDSISFMGFQCILLDLVVLFTVFTVLLVKTILDNLLARRKSVRLIGPINCF